MTQYIRQDEASIRFLLYPIGSMQGQWIPAQGVDWATYAGGAKESTDVKVRPGGLKAQVSIGGPSTRADLTLTIPMSDLMAAVHPLLESNVGKARVNAVVNWLNPDGTHVNGAAFTRVGTLKSAELPEANIDGTTLGMYTVIVSCDEHAT